MNPEQDKEFTRAALAMARRAQGRTWPNPGVGCVIVKDGVIIGRGWTQPGGRPHAEAIALQRAGAGARGATAYVSLEPCAHYGKTPPCTRALIEAGISRVVTPLVDPDKRVNGLGVRQLADAGISVSQGLLEEEASALHAGYIMRQLAGRPAFTLKLAQSLDGRIATSTGKSQWITGDLARRYAHMLRARHDAILVGSGTAVADDPMLDCRLEGLEDRSPVRILLDRRLRTPVESKLVATAGDVPVWLMTCEHEGSKAATMRAAGVRVLPYPDGGLPAVAKLLGAEMLTTVMIEGGGQLAASFIAAGLVDRLDLVAAPIILGGDGTPSIAGLGLDELDEASSWRCVLTRMLGKDRLTVYQRQRAS